jgi:hypothetical protein
MKRRLLTVDIGRSAVRYMASHMGLTSPLYDQGENQTLRHLVQFANRMIKADRAAAKKTARGERT